MIQKRKRKGLRTFSENTKRQQLGGHRKAHSQGQGKRGSLEALPERSCDACLKLPG